MSDHILVIHRWSDDYALYEDYIDHDLLHVTYVTTALGRRSVPRTAAGIVTVAATDDLRQVQEAAATLSVRFGRPSRVIALNEGDLDTAALLRSHLGCPGQDPAQLARYRDKLTMTEIIAGAGLRTPAFADAPDGASVKEFGQTHGWPVVVKPRRGTASRGVTRFNSVEELADLDTLPHEDRLVQTLCGDVVHHVDGVWTGTGLGPWRASRYLNTCVDFTTGSSLGSVEVDDPALLASLEEFTASVARVLAGRTPWVFHLEVFVGAGDEDSPRITFLEAGNRVGGAEIPFVWREVHGIDLMAIATAIQMGAAPSASVPAAWRTGGWLLIPPPVPAPCRVVRAEVPRTMESLYSQVVPSLGYVLPKIGGYEHVGARFRFEGPSTLSVEQSIRDTAAQVELDCVPVPPATPATRPACGLDR